MSNSLREKLLGLGFKAPEPEKRPEPRAERRPEGGREGNRDGRPPRRPEGGARPDRRPGADGKPRHEGAPRTGPDGKPRNERGPRSGADGRPQDARGPRTGPDGKPRPAGQPGERRGDGRPRPAGKPGEARPPSNAPRRPAKPRSQEEIDLAKAYAIRAQKEKEERIEAERVKQEEARLRREAKARLAELVKDQGLNDKAADIARHFPYGGKIKRIHVTADQLKALNAGELGVLQLDGRYLLVTAAMLDEAEKVFAPAVALRVDPNAPAGEDPYADPQYQVPDDLVW